MTRALVVVELEVTAMDHLVEALLAIMPESVPHFAGKVRLTMDGAQAGDPATAIVDYLDGTSELPQACEWCAGR